MHKYKLGDLIYDPLVDVYEVIVAIRECGTSYRYLTTIVGIGEVTLYKDGDFVNWIECIIDEYYLKVGNIMNKYRDIEYKIIHHNGRWYVCENYSVLDSFDKKEDAERYLEAYKKVMR